MPGIVGLITRIPKEQAVRQLHCMVETLLHESFYLSGMWVEESLGVYVGWIERESSFSHVMPLRSKRGEVVVVFSGEEYSKPGPTQSLKTRENELDASDPNYLVHLCEDDPSFPAGLNGRFHGLLIDRNRRTSTLFNDRYGMHRICYHEAKDTF
jgi:asparagine synthase (glutamine-hydrolysing)